MSITSSLTENFLPLPRKTSSPTRPPPQTQIFPTLQHRWMIEIRDQRYTITK